MNIRKSIFFLLDFLKGNLVQKHLSGLTNFSDQVKTKKELQRFQDKMLTQISKNAVENSAFYDSYKTNSNFSKFPVLNKAIIRNNIRELMHVGYKVEMLKEVVTSGSTGLPFKVYQDAQKVHRNSADAMFFAKKAGFEIGEKLVYLKIWNSFNKKSKLIEFTQNILPVDVHELSDRKIEEILTKLNSVSPEVHFLGYASAIETMALFVKRTNFGIKFKTLSILTMSEAISKKGKEIIEEVFSCKVCSRYSNVENGIIAQQTLHEPNVFLINSASYYVEILDMEKDHPVKEGELGRIVVTDYYNSGTFMIRYDTGDLGIKQTKEHDNGVSEYLTQVEGRKMDSIYNTKGDLVSSFVITNEMWDFSELLQYQFIQLGPSSYLFKLNIEKEFERGEELVQKFKGYLGEDAIIDIEIVDEIPLLASGKRKKVVNLMNN